jgi:hypothetical protein
VAVSARTALGTVDILGLAGAAAPQTPSAIPSSLRNTSTPGA